MGLFQSTAVGDFKPGLSASLPCFPFLDTSKSSGQVLLKLDCVLSPPVKSWMERDGPLLSFAVLHRSVQAHRDSAGMCLAMQWGGGTGQGSLAYPLACLW